MRLTNTMKSKLLLLVIEEAKAKHGVQTNIADVEQALVKLCYERVKKTEEYKNITAFADKYPDISRRVYVVLQVRKDLLFTPKQLEALGLDGKQAEVINLFRREDGRVTYEMDYVPKTLLAKELKQLAKEKHEVFITYKTQIEKCYKFSKFNKAVTEVINNANTDKQLITTLPELEKFFNDAGIVKPDAGKKLNLPSVSTAEISDYLKG